MSYSSGKITTGNLTLISDSSDNTTASLNSFGIRAQTVNASVINATTSTFGTDSSGNINGSIDVSGNVNVTVSLTANNISYFTTDTIYYGEPNYLNVSNYQYNYQYPIDTTLEIINNLITIPGSKIDVSGSVFNTIGVTAPNVDNTVFTETSGTYIRDTSLNYIINNGSGGAIVWTGSPPYPFLTNEVLSITAEGDINSAFERWPLIIALSRFGTFKGLENMQSGTWSTDLSNNPLAIQSFTFRDLIYDSSYFTFKSYEINDIFNNTLQIPSSYYQDVYNTLDSLGETPFISFGNNWKLTATPVNPLVIQGLSRSNISNYLTDTTNTITQDTISSANYITACLSVVTGNQPTDICNSSGVMAAKAALGI